MKRNRVLIAVLALVLTAAAAVMGGMALAADQPATSPENTVESDSWQASVGQQWPEIIGAQLSDSTAPSRTSREEAIAIASSKAKAAPNAPGITAKRMILNQGATSISNREVWVVTVPNAQLRLHGGPQRVSPSAPGKIKGTSVVIVDALSGKILESLSWAQGMTPAP